VKSLINNAADKGEQEPYLISIAERAESVMSALEDRQTSTQEALDQIETIVREKLEADKARKESGLDTPTFTIYWLLRQQGLEDAIALAKEINSVCGRFPNYRSNAGRIPPVKGGDLQSSAEGRERETDGRHHRADSKAPKAMKPIGTAQFKEKVSLWAKRIRVHSSQVRMQRMTRKLGSCSTAGWVSFARDLLGTSSAFQDYVIVHQLLHLKVPNHGKLFKSYLTAYLPDWKRYAPLADRR